MDAVSVSLLVRIAAWLGWLPVRACMLTFYIVLSILKLKSTPACAIQSGNVHRLAAVLCRCLSVDHTTIMNTHLRTPGYFKRQPALET